MPSTSSIYTTEPFEELTEQTKIEFNNNYLNDISLDNLNEDGSYYKLIKYTLRISMLEILVVSSKGLQYNNSNVKHITTFKGKNNSIHYLDLLYLPNTIENLFELLKYNSILNDNVTTKLIISKIFSYFKLNLLKYSSTEYDASSMANIDRVMLEFVNDNNHMELKGKMMDAIGINHSSLTKERMDASLVTNYFNDTYSYNEDNGDDEEEDEDIIGDVTPTILINEHELVYLNDGEPQENIGESERLQENNSESKRESIGGSNRVNSTKKITKKITKKNKKSKQIFKSKGKKPHSTRKNRRKH